MPLSALVEGVRRNVFEFDDRMWGMVSELAAAGTVKVVTECCRAPAIPSEIRSPSANGVTYRFFRSDRCAHFNDAPACIELQSRIAARFRELGLPVQASIVVGGGDPERTMLAVDLLVSAEPTRLGITVMSEPVPEGELPPLVSRCHAFGRMGIRWVVLTPRYPSRGVWSLVRGGKLITLLEYDPATVSVMGMDPNEVAETLLRVPIRGQVSDRIRKFIVRSQASRISNEDGTEEYVSSHEVVFGGEVIKCELSTRTDNEFNQDMISLLKTRPEPLEVLKQAVVEIWQIESALGLFVGPHRYSDPGSDTIVYESWAKDLKPLASSVVIHTSGNPVVNSELDFLMSRKYDPNYWKSNSPGTFSGIRQRLSEMRSAGFVVVRTKD